MSVHEAIAFAMLHCLGVRRYTCLISGTASFGLFQGLCGSAYLVFYGLAVVGIPVLLLAAVLARGVLICDQPKKGRR